MEKRTLLQRAINVYRDGGEESFWPWFEQLSEQDQAEVETQMEELREEVVAVFEVWVGKMSDWLGALAERLGPIFLEGDGECQG